VWFVFRQGIFRLVLTSDKLIIQGGLPLTGKVTVSGAKNSVLKLMGAALLTPHQVELHNVPNLSDVKVMTEVLRHLGTNVSHHGNVMTIDASHLHCTEAPYELVSKMRASFIVLGALLGRFGQAMVSLPGGCSIGKRGVDLHIKGLQSLGAEIQINQGYAEASAKKLEGKEIVLDTPSVGATENIMLAAVLAEGVTTLSNAAQEPEIVDLANFLNAIGADISGAGTNEIIINGVSKEKLTGATYAVVPDRIEAATYMIAAAATHGDIVVDKIIPSHLAALVHKLEDAGVQIINEGPNTLRVKANGRLIAQNIVTQPYPGFPTDLQAPFMALMTTAQGVSIITETLYENRFKQVGELNRMGANIQTEGDVAIISGSEYLSAAPVKASDLRAGAALVIAGLMGRGSTEISDLAHIDRGYEHLVEKLQGLGARIQRVSHQTEVSPEELKAPLI
jgi:UDP-N-acetylglucosamine 1-carboxyvinyltransferase